ncbi:hypothetical protein F383_24758 [Gossypium arboreum]|uniref:Uncharacterized protein n=1 Tax=Gossypium arboreum TaxID=29729 RepID=A0A0B0P569_GOSAR|nr:hypothetical protein F383_24758 [Gossypium arboreum]
MRAEYEISEKVSTKFQRPKSSVRTLGIVRIHMS